jgi:hypothetical protein
MQKSKLGRHAGDVISPKEAGRTRPMCAKLSPEMKAVVWSSPRSNAGVGWIQHGPVRWRNRDDQTSVKPDLDLGRPEVSHSDAMLKPNGPRRGIPGAGYATFHMEKFK